MCLARLWRREWPSLKRSTSGWSNARTVSFIFFKTVRPATLFFWARPIPSPHLQSSMSRSVSGATAAGRSTPIIRKRFSDSKLIHRRPLKRILSLLIKKTPDACYRECGEQNEGHRVECKPALSIQPANKKRCQYGHYQECKQLRKCDSMSLKRTPEETMVESFLGRVFGANELGSGPGLGEIERN